MVPGEVSLCRLEKLFFGFPPELRPALTEGDPLMVLFDCSHACTLLSCRCRYVSRSLPGTETRRQWRGTRVKQ